jgi:hypothetical protein
MKMTQDQIKSYLLGQVKKLQHEIQELKAWKESAVLVLDEWEKVWKAAGKPGRLGASKAASVREFLSVPTLPTALGLAMLHPAQVYENNETIAGGICDFCEENASALKAFNRAPMAGKHYCRKCAPMSETDADWPNETNATTGSKKDDHE